MKLKSREIKFRVWENDTKRMCYEFGDGTKEVIARGVNETCKRYLEDENWELMQYTGLKDKNGKEIYEGDVVEREDYYGDEKRKFREQVEFGGGAFNPISEISSEEFKVLGNIYENPELLKRN